MKFRQHRKPIEIIKCTFEIGKDSKGAYLTTGNKVDSRHRMDPLESNFLHDFTKKPDIRYTPLRPRITSIVVRWRWIWIKDEIVHLLVLHISGRWVARLGLCYFHLNPTTLQRRFSENIKGPELGNSPPVRAQKSQFHPSIYSFFFVGRNSWDDTSLL